MVLRLIATVMVDKGLKFQRFIYSKMDECMYFDHFSCYIYYTNHRNVLQVQSEFTLPKWASYQRVLYRSLYLRRTSRDYIYIAIFLFSLWSLVMVFSQKRIIQLEGIRCFTNIFTSTDDDSKKSLQIYPHLLLVLAFFLMATIAVYIIIPEIRDTIHGVSTMWYFTCTAFFYVSLAIIKLGVGIDQDKYETNSLCKPLGNNIKLPEGIMLLST